MKAKKFLVLFLVFALAATLAFAAGNGEEVTPTTAAPGEPQYGGTLTYLTMTGPVTFHIKRDKFLTVFRSPQ